MIARRPYPRTLLAVLAVIAVTLCGAALAWACTPDANIDARGPSGGPFGPSGSQLAVHGTGFASGAPVQVRMTARSGATVQDLATAVGPSFTVTTRVPSVPEGTYYIVATAPDTNGTTRRAASAFVVGEPAASSPPPDTAPTPGDAPTGPKPGAGSPTPVPNPEGTGAPGPTPNTNGGDRAGGGQGGDPVNGRTPARTDRDGATAGGGGVATLPSGQAVFSDSVASASKRDAGAAKSGPSERSASGDLWSGLSSDEPGLLGGAVRPSDGRGSALTWGVGLAGLGLMLLLAGLGTAELRRRRSPAR